MQLHSLSLLYVFIRKLGNIQNMPILDMEKLFHVSIAYNGYVVAFICLSVFSLIFASVPVSVPYTARKMRAKRTNRVLFCWMSMKNLFFF